MRSPSRLATRYTLATGITLITVATASLGYATWAASVKQHELTLGLLRSSAQFAAQRMATSIVSEFYIAASYVLQPVGGGRARVTGGPIVPLTMVLARGDSIRTCGCAPPVTIAYAFRLGSSDEIDADGALIPDSAEMSGIRTQVRNTAAAIAGGWDIAIAWSPAFDSRLVFFTHTLSSSREETYYGIAIDTASLREAVFRPLLASISTLAGSEHTRAPRDSIVAFRITDPGGRLVFATRYAADSQLVAHVKMPTEFGGLTIAAGVLPAGAAFVLPGGVPRSPIPALVVLVTFAAALVGTATYLLMRVHEIGKLRESFTSSVSHELRTPLTQILLYADMIEMRHGRYAPETVKAASVITRETRRLIHLVENVLHFSRAGRGVSRARTQRVPLATLVHDVVESFSLIAASRDVAIHVSSNASISAIADADACRRIVLNFLDNAVRHGTGGRRIDVSVSVRGSWCRIAVDDAGPGVADNRRRAIWKPYVRDSSSATGTGIGLAIVRDLVSLQGGRCGVARSPLGGARFFAEFPAAPDVTPAPALTEVAP